MEHQTVVVFVKPLENFSFNRNRIPWKPGRKKETTLEFLLSGEINKNKEGFSFICICFKINFELILKLSKRLKDSMELDEGLVSFFPSFFLFLMRIFFSSFVS